MIPAAHEELHPDQQGGFAEVGYRISFGHATIYHSGDCCPYDGLESRIMNCDALILPVNGRDYYRRNVKDIIGCFDSTEAITLAANTHAGMLIPLGPVPRERDQPGNLCGSCPPPASGTSFSHLCSRRMLHIVGLSLIEGEKNPENTDFSAFSGFHLLI